MNRYLVLLGLIAATAALVRSVYDFRAPGRMPLVDLVRDRYGRTASRGREIAAGAGLGTAVVALPVLAFALAGRVEFERVPADVSAMWILLMVATFVVKLLWAALEELVFRGALLVQIARFAPAVVAIVLSALLFGCAHLRRWSAAPDPPSVAILVLDGVGFAIAALGTRSLWLPTAWHFSKNAMIWLLFGESTMQLAALPWRVRPAGPAIWTGGPHEAGAADVAATAAAVLVVASALRRRRAAALRA